jgi:GNAT superfamily N-acetyltransferase
MPLSIRRLTPRLMDDMGCVLRGSWGAGCWCMYPRIPAQARGMSSRQRREAMTKIARRRRAPGLMAYEGDEPVGWVAIAPRAEYQRIENSSATPRIDEVEVWVIPCVTVRPMARGQGIAIALIREAVKFAKKYGAPAVEAYPRAGTARTTDDNAFFGTEPMFRRAGFRVIAKSKRRRLRRVTMRKAL